jgi:two-component system cell cycle sensor histidine kinase/response regulator CckA
MIDELRKLRELTETLTGNGYLRDQAEEWEYALDAIPDPIYIINPSFRIKFINKTLAEKLDVAKDDCTNKLCYEYIRGYKEGEVPADWASVEVVKDKPLLKEEYIEKLNGWFHITRSPIYTRTGKLLGFICVLQDITAEKEARELLLKREATLETIFNATPIGIGLLRRGSRIIKAVNQTIVDMTGYSAEELIGQSARLLYASDEEYERVGIEKYSRMDEVGYGDTEAKIKTKDGRLMNVYLKSAKVGVNGSAVFTITDLTDIKESKQRTRLFVEQTPLGVVGWDLNFKVNTWNKSAEEIFGWSEQEVMGKHSSIIVPEEEQIHVATIWKGLLKNTGGKRSTNKNITKNGTELYCEWYNNALIDAAGEPIGVMSLVMNVTEVKLHEKRLATALGSLKASQDKFKAVFEVSPDVITVVSLGDGILVDVNPAYENYTGWKREEVVGRNVIELGIWDRAEDRDKFYTLLATGQPIRDMKSSFVLKDGSVREGLLCASIVELGGKPHAISIIREK